MSNYLHQTGKENINQPVFLSEEAHKFTANQKIETFNTKPVPSAVGNTHLGSGMPEAYMSASGYYAANNTGFPTISFPNVNQPAQWSTATNNGPPNSQNYDYTAMQYSALNAAPTAPANAEATPPNPQYVTADHLFNQNNSTYQSAFSAGPFMNGSWSYFNNPNSYFFPTGNGDLNLNWGTAAPTDNPNNALFQDLYKPPPLPTEVEKQSKGEANPSTELSSGLPTAFENGEIKAPAVEPVEQSLSSMTVTEKEVDKNLDTAVAPPSSLSSSTVSAPVKHSAPVSNPSGHSNAPAKPVSWAAVASQPAKSKPPPKKAPPKTSAQVNSSKPNYSSQNGTMSNVKGKQQQPTGGRWNRQNQGNQNNNTGVDNTVAVPNDSHLDINRMKDNSPLLKKLMNKFNFNPRELNLDMKNARFFIIKSYSEDDIFRSIKYSSWTSTEHGNRRLNDAFSEQEKSGVKTPIYLLFSVNSSGHFCGVAEMKSTVDFDVETGIFVQDKWKGRFDVRWIYVKDVPNSTLRHIRLENNENKPVTNSRDTQEVHPDKAKQVLKIIHNYKAQTSIFDDFSHYEKRQEEDAKMRSKKMPEPDL